MKDRWKQIARARWPRSHTFVGGAMSRKRKRRDDIRCRRTAKRVARRAMRAEIGEW